MLFSAEFCDTSQDRLLSSTDSKMWCLQESFFSMIPSYINIKIFGQTEIILSVLDHALRRSEMFIHSMVPISISNKSIGYGIALRSIAK